MKDIDIRFIAKEAGVSPATVSRVLNGSKPVSQELRDKVISTVRRYKYHPDMIARNISAKKTNLIGVVTPNVSNYFHSKLVGSIEKTASLQGYSVMLSNDTSDFNSERHCFKVFKERGIDGIILLHENSSEELDELSVIAGVPIVMASTNALGSNIPKVGIDDRLAAYDAVSCLLRLGHRRIGAIFNDCYSLNVLRRQGFEDALREFGVTPDSRWIKVGNCSIEDGEIMASRIFSGSETPTALFCVSDEQAVGAQDYLIDHGYRIPDEVSIIGFDDVEISSVVRPRLSTIRQPIEEIGRIATQMLIQHIETNTAPHSVTLSHLLVMRDSTGRCL